MQVILAEGISSEEVERDGSLIKLTAAENVAIDGRIIIKKGAAVSGKIVDVVPSTNKRKKALIGFVIQHAVAVDGSRIRLRSERFRLFANAPGTAVSFKSGQSFVAELARGRLR